jgi:hypothetical protein
MGPIFASQKTGAALLQEGNYGEYQEDDTSEAVCNDTTNNSTSVIFRLCSFRHFNPISPRFLLRPAC